MKIQKTLLTAMMAVMLTLVLLSATSCELSHEHAFADWETVTEPTCASFGLKKRSCECGQIEYDTVEALAHTPVTDAAVPATCTTPGKTEGSHCGACGAVIVKQLEVDKHSHSISEWETVSAPTCTSIGLKKRSCVCGQTEYDTLEALGHTPVTDAAVLATCTDPGKTEGSHCDTCGFVIVAQHTILPVGHSCDEVTVLEAAECNLDGTKRYSCTNDGCSYYYDEGYSLPALDSSEIYANAVQYTGIILGFDRFGNQVLGASAFVISPDGRIVTSVLATDNSFSLTFYLSGNYYEVTEVLAYDTEKCVAVLQVDASDLPYAKLCTRTPVNGETVYLVGAPDGYEASLATAVVANNALMLDDEAYIQHDAMATRGFIGSPLINKFGEVIGINVGYTGDDDLGVAVRMGDLDSLDYSNPMSVYEYGTATYTPVEELGEWVQNFYTAIGDGTLAHVIQGKDFYYALGYGEYIGCYIEGYWKKDEGYELYVCVFFNNADGTYQYYASLTDGVRKNEASGYIDAASYTAATVLTYDTYYGRYWTESELMALYSTAVYDTLGWFSSCLDTYFDTLTLETFGFTAVSYDKDADALAKLNALVMAEGTYNESTGAYELSMDSEAGEDFVILTLTHVPMTAQAPASTIATIEYYAASGVLFHISLSLDPTENGHRFELAYAAYNGTEYVVQNVGWGYLEAGEFTNASTLTCYEFNGMNEYEDGLLTDYAFYLSHLMTWMDYVMENVDTGLSVKDLGFLFYFG